MVVQRKLTIARLMGLIAVVAVVCAIPASFLGLMLWIGSVAGYFVRMRGRRGGLIGSAAGGVAMAWALGCAVALSDPAWPEFDQAIRGAVLFTFLGVGVGAGVACALMLLEMVCRSVARFPGTIQLRAQRSAAANAAPCLRRKLNQAETGKASCQVRPASSSAAAPL